MVESAIYAGLGDIFGAILAVYVCSQIQNEKETLRRIELILSIVIYKF